jgi:hypothetical protein
LSALLVAATSAPAVSGTDAQLTKPQELSVQMMTCAFSYNVYALTSGVPVRDVVLASSAYLKAAEIFAGKEFVDANRETIRQKALADSKTKVTADPAQTPQLLLQLIESCDKDLPNAAGANNSFKPNPLRGSD